MAALFVAGAVKGDRRPPLLDIEADAGVLHLPRTGESFSTASGLQLAIQSVKFVRVGMNEAALYGALHLMPRSGECIPIGVESCVGHLRKQVKKFAEWAGLEVHELPALRLNEKAPIKNTAEPWKLPTP